MGAALEDDEEEPTQVGPPQAVTIKCEYCEGRRSFFIWFDRRPMRRRCAACHGSGIQVVRLAPTQCKAHMN